MRKLPDHEEGAWCEKMMDDIRGAENCGMLKTEAALRKTAQRYLDDHYPDLSVAGALAITAPAIQVSALPSSSPLPSEPRKSALPPKKPKPAADPFGGSRN